MTNTAELDRLSINTIRTLSIDAVQAANSGHPGTPMALAPLAYTIWNRILRFDPQDSIWPNRDRDVSAGGDRASILASEYPREQRDHGAEEQHRRNRGEELEVGSVDDDVTRQVKERQTLEPGPDEAGDDQRGAENDEQAVHDGQDYKVRATQARQQFAIATSSI